MPGDSTVTGFNGAGVKGGDRIMIETPDSEFSENTNTLTVDAVGLVKGVGWFFT